MAAMHELLRQPRAGPDRRLERAIVVALLGKVEQQRCATTRLASELDVAPRVLEAPLARLCDAGVVCVQGAEVWASRAARHLEQLELIGI